MLFRSGLVFLYEPYIFTLSDGSKYVPDFFILHSHTFVEVKGLWEPGAKKKFKLFVQGFKYTTYLADLEFINLISRRSPHA